MATSTGVRVLSISMNAILISSLKFLSVARTRSVAQRSCSTLLPSRVADYTIGYRILAQHLVSSRNG